MAKTDLVEFIIPQHSINKGPMQELVHDCFGIPRRTYVTSEPLTIVCRLTQWGRFVILRNNRGITNAFRELQPRMLSRAGKSRVDASNNSTVYGHMPDLWEGEGGDKK